MIKAIKSHNFRRYNRNAYDIRSLFIQISKEVQSAILNRLPVVALESTIISHGMPYPKNIQVALEVEGIIRKQGAIPATIGIINGIPKVGLSESDLITLANHYGNVQKASTKDLSKVCSQKLTAATTVASTMIIANLAGISIFATGGIGGVHRGAEITMDISADLLELSRTPVMVVCAGIKSILDIPKTLEVLESYSVPVLTYQSSTFPCFYTNDSGICSPVNMDTYEDIANIMKYQKDFQLHSGVLVAVPNPEPGNAEKIQYAIDFAILSAHNEGIKGSAITPYILEKVQQLTSGESLDSNIALIKNNALVAANIAIEYCKLKNSDVYSDTTHTVVLPSNQEHRFVEDIDHIKSSAKDPLSIEDCTKDALSLSSVDPTTLSVAWEDHDIIVIGAAVVDLIGTVHTMTKYKTSNPGQLQISNGGVGRNVAQSLALLGIKVKLATVVGDDVNGHKLIQDCRNLGINTSLMKILHTSNISSLEENPYSIEQIPYRTAVYNAIHDHTGDLCIGISDMSILQEINKEHILKSLMKHINTSKIIVLDGNLSRESFITAINIACYANVSIFFEPTSNHKCLLPLQTNCLHKIDIIKPNIHELIQMTHYCISNDLINNGKALVSNILSNIVSNRIDSIQKDIDLTDARILVNALYQVMDRNYLLNNEDMLSINTYNTTTTTTTTANNNNNNNNIKNNKVTTGKHIIVSLGKRGILWCGPSNILTNNKINYPTKIKEIISIDNISTCYIPAIDINELKIINTNGAGDAFCGGFLSKLIHLYNNSSNIDTKMKEKLLLPNIECIESGILNAHNWIISK